MRDAVSTYPNEHLPGMLTDNPQANRTILVMLQ